MDVILEPRDQLGDLSSCSRVGLGWKGFDGAAPAKDCSSFRFCTRGSLPRWLRKRLNRVQSGTGPKPPCPLSARPLGATCWCREPCVDEGKASP